MTESELRAAHLARQKILSAWGSFVLDTIQKKIEAHEGDISIQIRASPRIKDVDKFIEKALYRGKGYKNPFEEITDGVGIRLVVLIESQIKDIAEIIESNEAWKSSRDRDYELEKEANPALFGYQSVHYVVRNVKDIMFQGIEIEKGIPCEIQLRTLLQHAYSEVTHDTLYKPQIKTNPGMHRRIARSMALMEAADITFSEVFAEIDKLKRDTEGIVSRYRHLYAEFGDAAENSKLTSLLLEAYRDQLNSIADSDLKKFCYEHGYLEQRITERSRDQLLFAQPIILGIYFIIDSQPHAAKASWPFTELELQIMYTDLGRAFDV